MPVVHSLSIRIEIIIQLNIVVLACWRHNYFHRLGGNGYKCLIISLVLTRFCQYSHSQKAVIFWELAWFSIHQSAVSSTLSTNINTSALFVMLHKLRLIHLWIPISNKWIEGQEGSFWEVIKNILYIWFSHSILK